MRDLEPEPETTTTDEEWLRWSPADKTADSDLVREFLAFTADQFMDAELDALTATANGARTPMRELQRNGYQDRDEDIHAGWIALEMPEPRKGNCPPASWTPAEQLRRPS